MFREKIRDNIRDKRVWVLGTGYWVLGTGYWVLGTGYWVPSGVEATSYCLLLVLNFEGSIVGR